MKQLALIGLGTLLLAGCQAEMTSEPVVDTPAKTLEPASEIVVENETSTIVATPAAFNVEGAPTKSFHVPDMMCEFACPPAVKDVLVAQAGVKDVKVDFESKQAIVAVDETAFDADAAIAALVDYQFSNTKLVTAEEN